ncbi:MAG: hypothetical protein U0903_22505 [Planctomycetales bacterium]
MAENLRHTFRYPANAEREPAVLKLKRQELPARMVNESAGGFGICVEGNVPCEPGEDVLLLTYSGWHGAQVIRSEVTEENETCLGLLRTADFVDSQPPKLPKVKKVKYRVATAGMRNEYLIGIAVIFLVPLLPFLFTIFWEETPDLDHQGKVAHQMENRAARKVKKPEEEFLYSFGKTMETGMRTMGKVTTAGGKALVSAFTSNKAREVMSGYSDEEKIRLREILTSEEANSQSGLKNLLQQNFSGLGSLFNSSSASEREGLRNMLLEDLDKKQ